MRVCIWPWIKCIAADAFDNCPMTFSTHQNGEMHQPTHLLEKQLVENYCSTASGKIRVLVMNNIGIGEERRKLAACINVEK
jgi:hypothetical protein